MTAPRPTHPAAPSQPTPTAQRKPRRLVDWFLGASTVGFLVSLAVHLATGVAASAIFVAASGRGAGDAGEIVASSGVEVLTETQLTSLAQSDPSAPAVSAESLPEIAAPRIDLADATPDPTLGGATADVGALGGAGLGGAGAGISGDDFGQGGGGGGGGGGASFFGVEAAGARFAYICDVSGSMSGEKLLALRSELGKSIDGLLQSSSYAIVLFSSEARPLTDRWTEATTRNKANTIRRLEKEAASGATNPAPAFEVVFNLKPRPDAIYFMTDGLFASDVAEHVAALNRAGGGRLTPIHCIAFVSTEAETLMKAIAEESGGSYTYVPGPSAVGQPGGSR